MIGNMWLMLPPHPRSRLQVTTTQRRADTNGSTLVTMADSINSGALLRLQQFSLCERLTDSTSSDASMQERTGRTPGAPCHTQAGTGHSTPSGNGFRQQHAQAFCLHC